MDETRNKAQKEDTNGFWLKWILMVSLSPLACLLFMLVALRGLLVFFSKAALLFIIVAINTPFATMYNFSVLVAKYNNLACCQKRLHFKTRWNWRIAKTNVAVEIKLFVSDFIKVVAPELLVVISTGVITYFTAPILVFGISTGVWVLAIIHKWLNTDCLSRTALSCLCDCLGLSPLTFFFSFIGFFDIGCHPVAKCTFAASQAFLFVKKKKKKKDIEEGAFLKNDIEEGDSKLDGKDRPNNGENVVYFETNGKKERKRKASIDCEEDKGDKQLDDEANLHRCNGAKIEEEKLVIDFPRWNAFDQALFLLNPRIEISKEDLGRNYIVKSSMVLKLGKKIQGHEIICEYPVETLELPEHYSKVIDLKKFLSHLSLEDGFVTDIMRGQYEKSLTLTQIVEGVEENSGYRIETPIDNVFVVTGCTKSEKEKRN